jgi:predicted DNA binding protein
MQVELERVVPTDGLPMPFFWATGEGFDALERKLRGSPAVEELRPFDRIGDSVLYRVEWLGDHRDLVEGIAQTGATVLRALGNDRWIFRLRFDDHDGLGQFQNYCADHDIAVHVDRVYALTETRGRERRFGLSREQREALVLALRRGYFETPSQVSLSELAAVLGISQQAVSNRVRRGNRQVLQNSLLAPASDAE